jgi:hypothetical protein
MKNIKILLKKIGITLQTGDVVSLHKGSFSVYPKRVDAKLNSAVEAQSVRIVPKSSQGSLKAVLHSAIESKEFDIKLKLLPDVAKFSVKLNEINPLLFTHGLQTRFGSMKTLVKGRNRSINRYLTYIMCDY